jgi:hypothetical protein
MGAFLDFLGWDSLSWAEQIAVVFYCTIGAVAGFVLAMWALALFGFGPRRPARKAKPRSKAKAKAKRRAVVRG